MTRLCTAAVLVLIGLAAPGTAQAWWHHGPRWHGGYYVAPPVYVPPPVYAPYYAAPPAYSPYAAPRYAGPPPAASSCSAGPYVCPLGVPATIGQSCACDTAQGRFWGHTN